MNKERIAARHRAFGEVNRENLTDCYVRKILSTTKYLVPKEMVEAKRLQIRIYRYIKEMK